MTIFSGRRPRDLGVHDGRLRDCPSSPNCVCSDASRESQRVDAFRLAKASAEAWRSLRESVEALPRTRVIRDTGSYLHAECRSALIGFVDDLELALRPDDGLVAVRSASRLGHSDLGVNRKRVGALRRELVRRGVVAPGSS
jgi:uncharacterized protein (DUF1499 family)